MKTNPWILTLASSLALACSSPQTPGFNSSGASSGSSSSGGSAGGSGSSGGGGSSGSGSSGATSSGGGSSSGSSGGGSSGASSSGVTFPDAGGGAGVNWGYTVPDSDLGTPVTLTAQPFQVAANSEVYMCEVFANPFNGVNTDIVKLHGVMSSGSHHFFLFNINSLNAAVEPAVGTIGACAGAGLEFHPFPYLSQQPVWDVAYPAAADGSPMGYPIVGTNELMINVHFLNAGTTAVNASVQITIYPAKPGVVKTHVGTLFLDNIGVSVPANTPKTTPVDSTSTWSGDSSLPANYTLFTSWQHMHRTALKFTASTNGSAFYTDTNWDSPGLFYHASGMQEPSTATGNKSSIPMTNSQSITWSCSYYNDTGNNLTFGDSAVSNVMCIYLGQYFPADPTNPDIVVNQK